MTSFKGELFYIITSSNLVYSQKNQLIALVNDAPEDKIAELKQIFAKAAPSEKIACLGKFFGIGNLSFEEDKGKGDKFGEQGIKIISL